MPRAERKKSRRVTPIFPAASLDHRPLAGIGLPPEITVPFLPRNYGTAA
jgi:hypothetical protein